jgi:hypothetical protein
MLSLKSYDSVHVTPSGLRACPLLDDIASEIHIGTAVSILKADRLEAYPTFAMVGCAAKPRSPDVANCRQTVEALLAPLSTAWQQMATMPHHRLAADGYDSRSRPILFVRNPPANRPNHRENRYNQEDWQHFLQPP